MSNYKLKIKDPVVIIEADENGFTFGNLQDLLRELAGRFNNRKFLYVNTISEKGKPDILLVIFEFESAD